MYHFLLAEKCRNELLMLMYIRVHRDRKIKRSSRMKSYSFETYEKEMLCFNVIYWLTISSSVLYILAEKKYYKNNSRNDSNFNYKSLRFLL